MEKTFTDNGVEYKLVVDKFAEFLPYVDTCRKCEFYNYNGHSCAIEAGLIKDPGIQCSGGYWKKVE